MLEDMGGGDARDLSATSRGGEEAGGVDGTTATASALAMSAVVEYECCLRIIDNAARLRSGCAPTRRNRSDGERQRGSLQALGSLKGCSDFVVLPVGAWKKDGMSHVPVRVQ